MTNDTKALMHTYQTFLKLGDQIKPENLTRMRSKCLKFGCTEGQLLVAEQAARDTSA